MGSLKLLGLPSKDKRSGRAIRSKKFVAPDCRVIDADTKQWVDGPCKSAPVRDWTKCTHGAPSVEELKAAGWEPKQMKVTTQMGNTFERIFATPSYFERTYRDVSTDEVEEIDGRLVVKGQVKERELVIKPRVIEVSASIRNSSGIGPAVAEMSGCLEVERFGIAPFCEFYNCFEQNPKQFSNGWFCNETEAKLVHADEHGTILALDYGEPNSKSRQIRSEQMGAISV